MKAEHYIDGDSETTEQNEILLACFTRTFIVLGSTLHKARDKWGRGVKATTKTALLYFFSFLLISESVVRPITEGNYV